MSDSLVGYKAIGEQRITLDDDTVRSLNIPEFTSAATVSATAGYIHYTIVEGVEPSAEFGRPIPDEEEVVLINRQWIDNFRVIRQAEQETYVYITFYRNG